MSLIPNKIYQGDVGTELLVNCGSDISGADIHELVVRKPDGTEVNWVCTIVNLKYLKYIIQVGDFDQVGQYKLQSHIRIPASGEWLGETTTFKVFKKYR